MKITGKYRLPVILFLSFSTLKAHKGSLTNIICIEGLSDEFSKISLICESTDSVNYVTMSNGLYKINQNSSKVSFVFPSRIPENIPSIFIDRKNNIYPGSQNGLVIISNGKLKAVRLMNPTFPFKQVLSLYTTTYRVLWLFVPGGLPPEILHQNQPGLTSAFQKQSIRNNSPLQALDECFKPEQTNTEFMPVIHFMNLCRHL